MKTNKILIPILTGLLFAAAANAQVDMTVTGSTAFRSISFNRIAALYDSGVVQKGDFSTGPGTYSGTMSNAIPSLGATPVTMRLSFSGSAAGVLAVANGTPVPTIDPVTGNTSNKVPVIMFSDVYPESASPPVNSSVYASSFSPGGPLILGIIPFTYVKNNGPTLAGVTNITREQAVLLCSDSGVQGGFNGMPATFLGGSSANPVYWVNRDPGSGHPCYHLQRHRVHRLAGGMGIYRRHVDSNQWLFVRGI